MTSPGDGIPDVVVPVYRAADLGVTILAAVHGRTGETLWTVSGANAGGSQGTVALANLDPSDASMEVVYVDRNRALVVLDGETTAELARFANATSATTYGNPSIHDMDGDARRRDRARRAGLRLHGIRRHLHALVTRWNASACASRARRTSGRREPGRRPTARDRVRRGRLRPRRHA
ncbi:MAG: hypothetical protein H6720_13560 [Sandaracinus sp.]|nr:hypothetical protein [Sandaracinus sp.]